MLESKTILSSLGKSLLGATLLVFLASCTPSEKQLTEEDLTSTSQFPGTQAVQTVSASQLEVQWTASSDPNIQGYNIYDATLKSQPRLVKTVSKDVLRTTISGLSEGFLYRYRVKAVGAGGVEDTNENDIHGIPYGGILEPVVVSSTSVDIVYENPQATEVRSLVIRCSNTVDTEEVEVANIQNLSLDRFRFSGLLPNVDYTCRVNAVIDGLEDNNEQRAVFRALGRADHLLFATQPGNGAAGDPLTVQPVVHVLDINDNIVAGGPDATALITLTISVASPTGGTIRGFASINAVAGVADFSDLFMEEAGAKIMTATKEDTSGDPGGFGTASTSLDSAGFQVTAGNISPDFTNMTVENAITPGNTPVANGTDAYTVTFNLRDSFNNPVVGIRPQFISTVPGDFLSQPLSPSDNAGVTTGSISTNTADTNGPTTRLLSVSSPAGLETIQVAAPFDPGPATKLAFAIQPANSPAGDFGLNEIRVAVQDNFGNVITTGGDATTNITISIANNVGGANLTGTPAKAAVNGVAIFDDLGIDQTGNGYKLAAAGGVLNPVQSNNFNVTAGIPRVISMTGGTSVLSGACSTVITLQLQDFGGNPAKAVANTTVQLAGLGNSSLYTSASCGGAPIGNSVTFTPGTDTRNLYLQSNKVESLTILGTDSSSVLTSSSYDIFVTPSRMRMVAQAAPPAPGGTPLAVTAGQCSTAITITPLAEDGSVGHVFTPTTVQVTGIVGSQAQLFSDPACTNLLDENNIALSQLAPPNEDTILYLRDPRGESLLINAFDPSGDIATISLPQEVNITGSDIDFVGPTTVVAGQCSSVFTITLEDTQGNNVPSVGNTTLDVVGMSGSPTGQFFTSPSCSGGGSNSSVIVPDGSAITTVYYRGLNAEILNLQITDPAGNMSDSQIINLAVSPSSFFIVNPSGPDESDSSICSERFRVRLRDGANANANAISTVVGNLSGAGASGAFYSDSSCTTEISSLTFNTGVGFQDFYFKGQFPETSLTITVTDNAAVLSSDTQSWVVNAAIGWLGSAGEQFSTGQNLIPFRTNLTEPVAARVNGMRQPWHMAFDPTKQFLYVVDRGDHRILKYDYTNSSFIGWMGRLRQEGGLVVTGSSIPTPSTASCIGTTNNTVLPGWCLGGGSVSQLHTTGGLFAPRAVTVDDTYVYVTNESSHTVNRYNAETGAFEGWIGTKNNTNPTGPATGGPPSCNVANSAAIPGWCIGGNSRDPGNYEGDGRIRFPRGLATDALYLYVGTEAQVLRYDKATGSFQGWIGRVNQTPSGGAAGCDVTTDNQMTPGWCIGGRGEEGDPRSGTGNISEASDIVIDTPNNFLYVLNSENGGAINRYNLTTGAFITKVNSADNFFNNAQQMFIDSGNFYIAGDERILRLDSNGDLDGWMGKVANNVGMANSGGTGCDSLSPNDNTNGWCIGGSQKSGLDQTAFIDQYGIVLDGSGSLLTTSLNRPIVKKFDLVTGSYQGAIGMESRAPASWSGDLTVGAQQEASDDLSYYSPGKPLIVGNSLYVTDRLNGRIKRFDKRTGELVGWIGGQTTSPTGGLTGACASSNPMSASPTFCTGALPYPNYTYGDVGMISNTANGIMNQPQGLTTDGLWLYVTDYNQHRVQRFDLNTGAYGGWFGRVNVSPTGGDPGCTGTPNDSFTPGWCLGGTSESGINDGNMQNPSGIEYVAGNLYVVDRARGRISRFNASTAAFTGWIGRVNAAPSSGCTTGSNGNYTVSQSGWCIGGSARESQDHSDRGGGFRFNWGSTIPEITSDGSFLYVGNVRNSRLDKIAFDGSFVEALRTREDVYSNTWQSDPASVAAIGNSERHRSMPQGMYVDATHIYVATAVPNARRNEPTGILKIDKVTGNAIGWRGGIDPDFPPTADPPSEGTTGCVGATGITPHWCQGGRVAAGTLPGQTAGYYGNLTGDDHFIYVTDRDGHRITRFPK